MSESIAGFEKGLETEPVQDLESHVIGDVFPAAGPDG